MKKIIFRLLILLSLINCESNRKNLNILTDQISLYEYVNYFNSTNKNIKIAIDYFDKKNVPSQGENNIFDYVDDNKLNNYDLIIGEKQANTTINKEKFSRITNYLKKYKEKRSASIFYPIVSDYIKNCNGYEYLYSIDFPVIIARKDSISENLSNEYEMDIDTFCRMAATVNQYKKKSQFNENRIGFTPLISQMGELDYYFIFNSKLENINNNYSFNTPNSQKAYDFYINYDDKFNYGKNVTKKYIKSVSNIDKSLYLKEKIISFDFINLSSALYYSPDLFNFFLIKNLKEASIKNKIITIQKSSINKKEAGIFIDSLYEYDSQKIILENTITNQDFYLSYHIPVVKGVLTEIGGLNISAELLEKYIGNLVPVNFYNNKIKKKFFEKYNYTKDMVNKGLISEKDFLEYFTEQLNK